MTVSAIRQILESRFSSQWGSATPIAWFNVDYTPVSGTSYVAFKINLHDGDFASIGHRPMSRTLGIAEINILTPAESQGTQTGATFADSAMAAFRDDYGRAWSSGGLRCSLPYVASVKKEAEWLRHTVLVPFSYDEHF
jgi:hypothetical protein